jgi:trehalose 6-phosphate synthase
MINSAILAMTEQHHAKLDVLCEQVLSNRNLIIVSNRGPVEYTRNSRGELEGHRGPGGVVTAMSAISRFANPLWVAAAMTDGDREMGQSDDPVQWSWGDYQFRLRFAVNDPEVYRQFYNVISNPLLWFLQHYMWDAARTPNITEETRRAWQCYETVNSSFADIVLDEVSKSTKPSMILLQDYQLYLVAEKLRPQLPPDTILTHFIHIPWPGPDYWALLPNNMRRQIAHSLCCCDIVGFHTRLYQRNFLRVCQEFLEDATVDTKAGTVTIDGHTMQTAVYPISIDVAGVLNFAESDEVRNYRQRLRAFTGDQTIVRIDRVEPSKNIVRGFQAFETLLEKYPDYRGRVKFLAFLVPSRLGVEEYKRYLEEIMVAVGWINTKYGDNEWQPVELFVGDHYARAIAAMQIADVLLVNPIIDGMNLVAKEGATVSQNNSVLILSERTGAVEQLAEGSLVVSPTDIVGTMETLHQALQMPLEERQRRAEWLRMSVAREDITMWLYDQLLDIQKLSQDDSIPAPSLALEHPKNERANDRHMEVLVGAK